MGLRQRTKDFLKRAVEAHLISEKERHKILIDTGAPKRELKRELHQISEKIAPHRKRRGRNNTLAAKAFRYANQHNVSLKSAWREVKKGLTE